MAVTLRATKGSRLTHAEMDENWKSVMGGHNFLHIQDQKPQNTHGGTFTSGAWRTRDLNTVLTNTITGSSLDSNQITLPAGKYYVEASSPFGIAAVGVWAAAQLYDIDNMEILINGQNSAAAASSGVVAMSQSTLFGIFTLDDDIQIILRHMINDTSTDRGFGNRMNFSDRTEVYSDIRIWRIGEYVAP